MLFLPKSKQERDGVMVLLQATGTCDPDFLPSLVSDEPIKSQSVWWGDYYQLVVLASVSFSTALPSGSSA